MQKPFLLIGSLVGGGMVLLLVVLGVMLFLASCAPRELKDRKLDQRTGVDLDGVGSVSLPPTFKLQGIVTWFDNFCVLLKGEGRPPQLVYKHAISTIAPNAPVNLFENEEDED